MTIFSKEYYLKWKKETEFHLEKPKESILQNNNFPKTIFIMITPLEKQQLLALYKKETGNPTGGAMSEMFKIKEQFKLIDYLEWLEHKLLTLINNEK